MLIRDDFLDEQLLQMDKITPWFANMCNFIVASKFPPEASRLYKEKIESDVKYYIWDDSYLWRLYRDQVIHRSNRSSTFVIQHLEAATMEQLRQLRKWLTVGSTGPPFSKMPINLSPPMNNVREQGWPLAEGMKCLSNQLCFVKSLMYGVLTLWGHSSWVEAATIKTNNAKVVVDFLKSNIFCRFSVSKALISNQYGVVHRVATAYHPQTNSQAKVFSREIKKILQKMANPSRKDWIRLLEDALWVHRIAYWTPLGMSPYQIVFSKSCHLPIEIEH
ncbi:hypothetical protein CR513_11289, partial [Mucuna pruriens]